MYELQEMCFSHVRSQLEFILGRLWLALLDRRSPATVYLETLST